MAYNQDEHQPERQTINGLLDTAIRNHHQNQTNTRDGQSNRNASKHQASSLGNYNMVGKTSDQNQTSSQQAEDPFFSMECKRTVTINNQNISPLNAPVGIHGIGYSQSQQHSSSTVNTILFPQHQSHMGTFINAGTQGQEQKFQRLNYQRKTDQNPNLFALKSQSVSSQLPGTAVASTQQQPTSSYPSIHQSVQGNPMSGAGNLVIQNVKGEILGNRLFFNEQRSLVRRAAAAQQVGALTGLAINTNSKQQE